MTIFPTAYSFYLSAFKVAHWNVGQAEFTGFSNYITVLSDYVFLRSLGFTILFTLLALVIELPLGFLFAYLLNELGTGRILKGLTTAILLPILLPPAATAIMFSLMLNQLVGIVPHLLSMLNLQLNLMSGAWTATAVLLAVDAWQWSPFFVLLIYAGLLMLPRDLLEAAHLDGAGHLKILRHIEVPLLRYVLVVAVTLRALWLLRTFEVVSLLTGGGPGIYTRTVSMQIYEYSFRIGLLGMGAAATIVVFLVVNVAVTVYYRYVGRGGGI